MCGLGAVFGRLSSSESSIHTFRKLLLNFDPKQSLHVVLKKTETADEAKRVPLLCVRRVFLWLFFVFSCFQDSLF